MTQKICILKGAPASGKSTWAINKLKEEPNTWKRVNRDSIRLMLDNGDWTPANEKMVIKVRNYIIQEALKNGLNVIVDDTNIPNKNWVDICKLVQEMNRDIFIFEKPFYEELEVLLDRDNKREGKARVGAEIVKKWYNELGKKQFEHYHARTETYLKRTITADRVVESMKQDETKQPTLICDLDGTLATIGNRSPYDASACDVEDFPTSHVVETVRLHFQAGYQIIFCSGRMEKDRAPTVRFIEKHLPKMPYLLLMRADKDQRRDSVVKEELFNAHIKDKYWVKCVIDDRLSVCRLWYSLGLNLLRVGDPDASF